MKLEHQLKLEELFQFLFALYMVWSQHPSWWLYPTLLLGPDIGMLGYLAGPRIGAFTYNLLHSKALALLLAAAGLHFFRSDAVLLAGIVMYGHASMDRIFGYGLKFQDSFQHTHLGWIGARHKASVRAGGSIGE